MSLNTGAAGVPTTQAAAPPSHAALTGAELPQRKEALHLRTRGHFGCVQLLQPCELWPARLLSVGFSSQEYWSLLANTGFHTLLEHCISCCPSHQLP